MGSDEHAPMCIKREDGDERKILEGVEGGGMLAGDPGDVPHPDLWATVN